MRWVWIGIVLAMLVCVGAVNGRNEGEYRLDGIPLGFKDGLDVGMKEAVASPEVPGQASDADDAEEGVDPRIQTKAPEIGGEDGEEDGMVTIHPGLVVGGLALVIVVPVVVHKMVSRRGPAYNLV